MRKTSLVWSGQVVWRHQTELANCVSGTKRKTSVKRIIFGLGILDFGPK
jgi:hypothetical protein